MDSPEKLAVESPSEVQETESQALARRSHQTYKARVRASIRLARRNAAWNSALVAFSTATTIASVGLLVNDQMYGRGGEALMVSLAILSLVASLVVSNVNYGGRAKAMETSYKQIQRISLAAERIDKRSTGSAQDTSDLSEISREYETAIETSENHSTVDHIRANNPKEIKMKAAYRVCDFLVTVSPCLSLVAPVLIVVPFADWFVDGL